jgi:hypothetical protein
MTGDTLARCEGIALLDRGDELWLVRMSSPSPIPIFFLAIIGLIALASGVTQLSIGAPDAAAGALATAAASLAVGLALVQRRRRHRRRPITPSAPMFIFAGGTLLDGKRCALAPLGEVRLTHGWQHTSSRASLVMSWPTGQAVISRGSPFGDSVEAIERALRSLGAG